MNMGLAVKITTPLRATALMPVVGLLLASAAMATDLTGHFPGISLSGSKVTNGGILLLEIDTRELNPPISDLRVSFQGSDRPVFPHPIQSDSHYFALLSIPYQTTLGRTDLKLTWSDPRGHQALSIPFKIVAGQYETDYLQVDPKRVKPSKKDQERALREQQEVNRIYATGSMERLWKGPFGFPLESDICSPYGNRRVFNGELRSYHNGIDFRALHGTPAMAANTGTVRLAKDLFYSGNAVIIDHGTGIFTIYAHLDKFKVAAGQQISKGQAIGLTGATGRVSGPHLHWGVKVNGVAVNPLQFVEVIASMVEQ
jgi:murein DD-endopeptidase MepM/ murein hydrolase activator NlpD